MKIFDLIIKSLQLQLDNKDSGRSRHAEHLSTDVRYWHKLDAQAATADSMPNLSASNSKDSKSSSPTKLSFDFISFSVYANRIRHATRSASSSSST